jgi:hypothetical protein
VPWNRLLSCVYQDIWRAYGGVMQRKFYIIITIIIIIMALHLFFGP